MIKKNAEKIAGKIFELFVLNDKVIAVQMPDGRYIPQFINYDYSLIQKMIEVGTSLGVYQQQYYRNVLKWICIDFDCVDGKDIKELTEKYVIPFCDSLDKLQINYLVEFSGRRGIHIWIHFDTIISKVEGAYVINSLTNSFSSKIWNDKKYGLDLFPSSSNINNKLGKLVKVPLSKHKKGTYSYFIDDIKSFKAKTIELLDEELLEKQYELLNNYSSNSKFSIYEKIGDFREENEKKYDLKYKKIFDILGTRITIEDIGKVFSKSIVLKSTYSRIVNGNMSIMDRKIILGTFAHVKNTEDLIKEIFKLQRNYDEYITKFNIQKLKKNYFPPTMGFLYDIYNIKPENEINLNKTTLEFLFEELKIDLDINEIKNNIKMHLNENFIESIIEKEKKYLFYNDEVVDVQIYNDLLRFREYDISKIKDLIDIICNEQKTFCMKNWFNIHVPKKYIRYEEKKDRVMVSLSAYDRVLTTSLIVKFSFILNCRFNSYSYNVNLWKDGEIFFSWFQSWKRFKNDVTSYFKLKIFEEYNFIKIDFKNFYDSIYLHSVYKEIQEYINEKSLNDEIPLKILDFLVRYNEILMKSLNGNIRGIPQGPAYARVIAEIYLSIILEKFLKIMQYREKDIKIYRYVDDVFIFYNDNINGDELISELDSFIKLKGLTLNFEKTNNYGKIKMMSKHDIGLMTEIDFIRYEIRSIEDIELQDEIEQEKKIELFDTYLYRNSEWNLNDANFILNSYINKKFIKQYIERFYYSIIRSSKGRGSIFSKFYNILFKDMELFEKFFDNRDYKEIPLLSLNFKNFLSCLYININDINKIKNNKELVIFALKYFHDNEQLDIDDKSTLIAILRICKNEEL